MYSVDQASDNTPSLEGVQNDEYRPQTQFFEKMDLHADKSNYTNRTFSTYVRAGDFIFCNFQAANPAGNIEQQTEECFRNLKETLKHAGATMDDVVKVTVLIKNPDEFQKMDDVYKRQFTNGYPARITTIVAGFLDEGGRIQIDAIAYKPVQG